MESESIWGYPYRLGIGLFITFGTLIIMAAFWAIAIWLERHFKNEREKQ